MGSRVPASAPAGEWLESPRLVTIVARAARQHGLREGDLQGILQDVRIALWELGLSTTATDSWIFRVATFKVIDLLRQRARDRRHDRAIAQGFGLARGDPGPPRDADLDHLLHVKAATLPPRLRAFYNLHYVLALTERETAEELGICRASARWLDRCCRRWLSTATQQPPRPRRPATKPKIFLHS